MKKLTKFLFAAFAMTVAFSSCNNGGDDGGKPGGEALRLVPSKTTLVANGIDEITFKVFQGEMDVTAISQVCAVSNGVCLINPPVFTTKEAGTHQYYAYLTNDFNVKSEPVTLTATESVFDATRTLHKNVTFMFFTATWCTWCGCYKNGMHTFMEEYGDRVVILNFYSGTNLGQNASYPEVGTNITGNFLTQMAEEEAKRFKLQGWPYTLINLEDDTFPGNATPTQILDPTNTGYIVNCYNKNAGVAATTGISVTSELGAEKIDVTVNVGANTADEYKIGVMLVEDHVVADQAYITQQGSGQWSYDYDHTNVLRDKATESLFGDEFGTFEASQVITKEYSFPIDAKYNTDNLSIVVYTLREKSAGVWIIDNSVKAPLGEVVDFKYAE